MRVPQLARADVSKILDYGASGVMVPMIETREQAEQFWQAGASIRQWEEEAIPAEPIRITVPAADMHRIWKR